MVDIIFGIAIVAGVFFGIRRILASGQAARILGRIGATTAGVFIGLSVSWSVACVILHALGHESPFAFGELFLAGISGVIGVLFIYMVGFSRSAAPSEAKAVFWKRSPLRLLWLGILVGLLCGVVAGAGVTGAHILGDSIGRLADRFR